VDECVFYCGQFIYVLYTYDSILASPNDQELDKAIADIQSSELQITVEQNVAVFLGVKITKHNYSKFEFTQPHLIENIIEELHLEKDNVAIKQTPAAPTTPLRCHSDQPSFDKHFNYHSIIGKLNYLEKST
jgi:hypothetical protein